MRKILIAVALLGGCNQAPTQPQVTIEPAEPKVNQALHMVMLTQSVDQNRNDIVQYDIRWFRDGNEIEELRGVDEVPAVKTFRGQTWLVQVTPTDGVLPGISGSDEVVITNTAPILEEVVLSPSQVDTNGTLTVSYTGSDPDDDLFEASIRWEISGTDANVTRKKISGLDYFDRDDEIQAFVTLDDGDLTSNEVASNIIVVENTPPTAPEIELTPLNPTLDRDALVCKVIVEGTDLDNDTLTYEIDWTVDGSAHTGSTRKTTWEGDTIPASELASEQRWTCSVRTFDGDSHSTSVESEVATVTGGHPNVGDTGSFGVISGNPWKVCRADPSSAWFAANSAGTYQPDRICAEYGYSKATAWGGTCGTVCGYCGRAGDEKYDGGGGNGTELKVTVHWKCE
ncbi:MAG: hypothetical protein ACI9MC_002184 [Kiritimatiellia bacterium]|jgi:hypothetical protein